MGRQRGKVDPEAFAIRRELRDVLGRLVGGDWVRPSQYEQDLQHLGRRRGLALRQVLSMLRERRAADEVSAMEILGRLASLEDAPALGRVANDPREPEGARVACALVLLGQDQAGLISAADISGLVLRWQARHLAEQPRLRDPLLRLYEGASEEERLRWIALQDEEIDDHAARAAVFEMLLEAECDARLRMLILEFLTRHPHPCVRATLRRIEPRSPAESDFITAALAVHAAAADGVSVPVGWSARVGFCDRGGSYLLRFDYCHGGQRPRAAVFVLDLFRGPWEALALTGPELSRYDATSRMSPDSSEEEPEAMYPIPVSEALSLLESAERAAEREGRKVPEEFASARRLLDPLADLLPKAPDPLPVPLLADATSRSALLVDLPGYRGWFYDSADRLLDDLRLEHLRRGGALQEVDDALLGAAIERLRDAGEPQHLSRRLKHNALVHCCAGEGEYAAIALAAAAACRTEEFAILPLVRRIVSASLHPGHYFFTPRPDLTCRRDLADLILEESRPTMGRVLAVDLAWILTRALEVWLSRVPLDQRPGSDLTHRAVVRLSSVGARWVVRQLRHRSLGPVSRKAAAGPSRGFGPRRSLLSGRYRQALGQLHFPPPVVDPLLAELCEMLTSATETLVFGICLESCSMECPVHPDLPGAKAISDHRFPAGDHAEARIRTWPGLWLHRPSRAERRALIASLPHQEPQQRDQPFECGVCHEERPPTARSRSILLSQEGLSFPVCRRCQNRYRRDPAFREEVEHNLGPLQSGP